MNTDSKNTKNNQCTIPCVSESLSEDDFYIEYMLNQMPKLTEEENQKKLKELDKCANLIRKKGIKPNLDSVY